jgi:membrane protein implicated in regulation of membrane protease activity
MGAARSVLLCSIACLVGATFAVVVGGLGLVVGSTSSAVLAPFIAAAVSVAGLAIALPWIDRRVRRGAANRGINPYSSLAKAAAGNRAGSVDHALSGLAQVLAEGTRAQRAVVWLAVEEKLVSAASYDGVKAAGARTVADLAALLAAPDVDHVVPVLDGSVLRAALTISKPGRPVTPADQRLMQDLANGAGLLLRGTQLNAELEQRVRRADELAAELQASRQRLTRARDVERHRLIAELTHVTTDRLVALRAELANTQQLPSGDAAWAQHAQHSIARARTGLDDLLDRFRVIARGVYPAVLRDQGPYGALDELATDLPRPVRLSGQLSQRLAWEVESGIYYLAASAMQQLARWSAEAPLQVHLQHTAGTLAVRIDDPTFDTVADDVLAGLTVDVDRLEALGGAVEIAEDSVSGITLRAWLPDQLEPSVDDTAQRRPDSFHRKGLP